MTGIRRSTTTGTMSTSPASLSSVYRSGSPALTEGTLSDLQVYGDRRRVCDLGVLRVPYKTPEASIGYRCPAEPGRAYSDVKGGRAINIEGRICLCNGLLATAGFAQLRSTGYVEPPVITGGGDNRAVADLLDPLSTDHEFYSASDMIDYLL